jgi:hypothetical protein
MNEPVLLVKEENGVVTLTLNRPEVMNSLNFPMLHALRDEIESPFVPERILKNVPRWHRNGSENIFLPSATCSLPSSN